MWNPDPITVKGGFVFRVPTFGIGSDITINVNGPGVSASYSDNGQLVDILVETPPLGTHNYEVSLEFCFPDDNPSGLICDEFVVNTQPVFVEEPEPPKVFVADYGDIHATNYPELCPSEFLGLLKPGVNGGVCVKGERVTDSTNADGGFVDLIICDVLGICESMKDEAPDLLDEALREMIY